MIKKIVCMYAKQTYVHMIIYMSKYIYTYIIIRLYTREFGEVFFGLPSPHLQENHLPFGFLWSDRPPQQKGFAGDLPGTGEGFNRAWFKWDLAPKRWKWS